jgi:hypothetical protein
VQNERLILTEDLRHRNIVRLLHTFVSEPSDAMLDRLDPESRDKMEQRDLRAGTRVRVKAQYVAEAATMASTLLLHG